MELFKHKILKHIARRDYKPVKLNALAKRIGVNSEQYEQLREAFKQLQDDGKIQKDPKGLIKLPDMPGVVVGNFIANPRGFGFVEPFEANNFGDLFINRSGINGAMNGDAVAAKVYKSTRRGGQTRTNGEIIEIIERAHESLVGVLKRYDGQWYIEPDSTGFIDPVAVGDVSAKNAREGDKVVVDITSYPQHKEPARGVILKVLGKKGQYETEIEATIHRFDLGREFEEDCLEQARAAAREFDPEKIDAKRDDITELMILTIDPEDAKDFDDAISIEIDSAGNYHLGVHIADVSSFVGMDSPLDVEAKERGNSVYLPGRVIPMLPEILSNGICSLQPGQKRFAKSVYITYDPKGNVLGREYANSVIESKARLSYKQADSILKGGSEGFDGAVVELLKKMNSLARAIEKRRYQQGMLHLELPEIELEMDEEGRVVDAHPADDSYPHTIIEMFMVEANEAVASLLDRFNVPFMRRIHPPPDTFSLKKLDKFVKICGIKIPKVLDRGAIQELLKMVKGKSYEYAINLHILRSLQKAEYSPLHIEHFALASKQYCHFTSPIRRYADLLVHRLMDCYVRGELNKIGLEEVLTEETLIEVGSHISFTEQQATGAERDLKKLLVLEMLSDHIGETLDTVVTGLAKFGVFLQCKKYGIEGLMEFGDLGLDSWKYDEDKQAVVGKNSGETVRLGQEMKVRIESVSPEARYLYLSPVEPLVSSRVKAKNNPGRRKNRRNNKNQKGKGKRGRGRKKSSR